MAEKISNIVRSATVSDAATHRSDGTTPAPWDHNNSGHAELTINSGSASYNRDSRDLYARRESREASNPREQLERVSSGSRRQHVRNGSGTTGAASSGDYNNDNQHQRRHDYDVQAMESDLSPRPGSMFRTAIPAPTVTIRSEFPTLSRSRQQQPLTCLITIEVPEGSRHQGSDDLSHLPTSPAGPRISHDISYRVKSFPSVPGRRIGQYDEPRESLDEIAEDLRMRVDNWHGLEFKRYESKCSFIIFIYFFIDSRIGSESFAYMAKYVLERTANHGRNCNAICSMRCSFASKKRSIPTIITSTATTTNRQNPSRHGVRSRALFLSRNTSKPSMRHQVVNPRGNLLTLRVS